ncbi:MAG: response regulator [Methanomassiliicoccus sp.]|nr:response regulator [Methanomassiliicoccus sp.]
MSKAIDVLIVEDNPADVLFMNELLADANVPISVTVANDGREALDILEGQRILGSPFPDMVILDLNMPRVNGFEVLRAIREIQGFHGIPVIVMTGSRNQDDEARARYLGATDYRVKPATTNEIDAAILWLRGILVPLLALKSKTEQPHSMGVSNAGMKIRFIACEMQPYRPFFDGRDLVPFIEPYGPR